MRVPPRRQLALERGQRQHGHAALVGEVLHRVLAGGQRAGDDDGVVAAAALLGGELDHGERRAADVEPRDRVHDAERPGAHRATAGIRACTSAAAAATTPIVSQKMAAIGVPPKSAAPATTPRSDAVQADGR